MVAVWVSKPKNQGSQKELVAGKIHRLIHINLMPTFLWKLPPPPTPPGQNLAMSMFCSNILIFAPECWKCTLRGPDFKISVVCSQTSDFRCLISDVWCQVDFRRLISGVWYQTSDIKRLISGVCSQTSDLRCLISDVWCPGLLSDVLCQVSVVRRLILDAWCQTSDLRCLISGVWCQVSDIRRLMSGSVICYQTSDVRCLMSDVWFQMSDVRRLISGVWYQTSDIRCLLSDVWS